MTRTIRACVGGDGKGQSSFEGVRRRAKASDDEKCEVAAIACRWFPGRGPRAR